jgi:hypothetical protein
MRASRDDPSISCVQCASRERVPPIILLAKLSLKVFSLKKNRSHPARSPARLWAAVGRSSICATSQQPSSNLVYSFSTFGPDIQLSTAHFVNFCFCEDIASQ